METLEEEIMDYLYQNRDREVSVYDLSVSDGHSVLALRGAADGLCQAGLIETVQFDGTTKIIEKGIREKETKGRERPRQTLSEKLLHSD